MTTPKLKVFPNPYSAVDHEGIPSGSCPSDPVHTAGHLAWVGARLDREATKTRQHADIEQNPIYAGDESRSLPQTTRFLFDLEPVEIPDTPHYRMALRVGDLVAADAEASAAGQIAEHRDPYLVLAEKRADAIERWLADFPGKLPAFVESEKLDPFWALKEACDKVLEARKAARAEAKKVSPKAASAEKKPVNASAMALEAFAKEQERRAVDAKKVATEARGAADSKKDQGAQPEKK